MIPDDERGLFREDLPKYVDICDNVSFHQSNIIRQWFVTHPRMLIEFLPPYSPFHNPIEELFSALEVEGVRSSATHTDDPAGCNGCSMDKAFQKRFFPRCIGRENIRCDVDENRGADRRERLDVSRQHNSAAGKVVP